MLSAFWQKNSISVSFRQYSSVYLIRSVVFLCGVGVSLSPFLRSLISILLRPLYNYWWCEDLCPSLHFDLMLPEIVYCETTFVIRSFPNQWLGWYFADGFDRCLNLIVPRETFPFLLTFIDWALTVGVPCIVTLLTSVKSLCIIYLMTRCFNYITVRSFCQMFRLLFWSVFLCAGVLFSFLF